MLRNSFKYFLYLVVLVGFSLARAGSYEDFFSAIKRDHPGPLRSLIERGFDPNTMSPQGQHGLYLAVQDQSLKAAEVLLEAPTLKPDVRNLDGETPLMMAALKGNLDIVRALIARGADVNMPGWTPLHYAATGGQPAIISVLLEAHAYIDAESPNKSTPLMLAAQYGTEESVKLLLEAGADPLLRNQLGLTAVDFARRSGREHIVAIMSEAHRRRRPPGKW